MTNLINNGGIIEFAPPVGGVFSRLTTVNYGPGGTLVLNTYLGTDGSPSDLLIINGGTTTGTSVLRIANAGGLGALTTGNGILVVDATNGTTTPNAFTLAGEVRGGAFDYFLFRGGINGSNPDDWFLRSDFTVPPNGGNGVNGGCININGGGGNGGGGGVTVLPGGGVQFPSEAPPNVLPCGIYPIIGPELATYGAVQPIARQLGLTSLGTHDDRRRPAALPAR